MDEIDTCINAAVSTPMNVLKDVRGWQFLTKEAAEALSMVCVPPEEHIFKKFG